MKKNNKQFWEKVTEFVHRVCAKISMSFEGKNVEFKITLDVTQPLEKQLQGIDTTILAYLPPKEKIAEYLTKQSEAV